MALSIAGKKEVGQPIKLRDDHYIEY